MGMSGLDRQALIERLHGGDEFEYVIFYRERDKWGCLSQFYRAPLTIDGIRYSTAEHFYMAEKARTFGDDEALAKILVAGPPKKAKNIAKNIIGFDRDQWYKDDHARRVAVRGNVAKFSDPENKEIRDILMSTGDAVLVEGAPFDYKWGIGIRWDDERASKPEEWEGDNLLGFALMDARQRIRDELSS